MANIPLGSYMSDGARVGPTFNLQTQTTPAVINPGPNTPIYALYSGNNNLKQGTLLTPLNTYIRTPAAPGGGFTQFNNVAAATDFAGAGYFTLAADNSVTKIQQNQLGANVVVFDIPRRVNIASSANVGAVNVTIFGLDYYGLPLQETVTAPTSATFVTTGRAFAAVTAAYASAATTGVTSISIGASGTGFGLPYAVIDKSYVMAYWGGNPITGNAIWQTGEETLVATAGGSVVTVSNLYLPASAVITLGNVTTTAGTEGALFVTGRTNSSGGTNNGSFTIQSTSATDTAVVSYQIMLPTGAVLELADTTNPATESDGDVRGIIVTPSPADGTSVLTVYMYVRGADNYINQQAALNNGLVTPVNGYTQLTAADLIGVPEYYTGNPG